MNKFLSNITARYVPHPAHKHTLRPELLELEGETAEWQYSWLMNDDESFPGVWALTTRDDRWLGYWVPEFDLEVDDE